MTKHFLDTNILLHAALANTDKLSVMKNITLSIDEVTLREARKYAAERNTTVNAMVREYLSSIAKREERVKQAVRRLKRLSADSKLEVGPVTWTRDDLYEH